MKERQNHIQQVGGKRDILYRCRRSSISLQLELLDTTRHTATGARLISIYSKLNN